MRPFSRLIAVLLRRRSWHLRRFAARRAKATPPVRPTSLPPAAVGTALNGDRVYVAGGTYSADVDGRPRARNGTRNIGADEAEGFWLPVVRP